MERPDRYSQYRLLDCECGSSHVVYLHAACADGRHMYRVTCLDCGAGTKFLPIKHDAQVLWNYGMRKEWKNGN